MAKYEYKVVPFIGKVNDKQGADVAGKQLAEVIAKNTYGDWELHQVTNVNIEVKPGCVPALFGAKEAYVRFDQVIFRKPVTETLKI
jgi:hypothetical protein